MTDQDRGAYTPPTDAPLSFDARQPVRGSRPLPLTLIVSGVVLVLLAGAIIAFYRSGVREAGQAPATVGQPVGPIAAAAPPDAQPADPAANLQIYKPEDGVAEPAAPTFTAPPEQPRPRPPAPSAPVQTAQLPPASPAAAGLKPAQPAPPPAPAVKVAPPPAPAPAAKAPPPAPKAAPAPAAGTFAVQIGAFSSPSQADRGYADAGRIAGVDIAGKSKRVEAIQKGGSTLYRTSVAGFASRAEAASFCSELKAAGKNCFVK